MPLIRHRALDPANRIGTLVTGHPAGTLDTLREIPPPFFALLARFDVVGYDGRGSGPTALDCGIDEDGNPCILGAAVAYLEEPTVLPPVGTVCDQVVDPF